MGMGQASSLGRYSYGRSPYHVAMDQSISERLETLRADMHQDITSTRTELLGEMRILNAELREAIARVEHQGQLRITAPLTPADIKDAREDALREILGRLHADFANLSDRFESIHTLFLFEFTDFRRWLRQRLSP